MSIFENKIKSLSEIETILDSFRKEGKKVVQCHGVFDLLHPGHIKHFYEAKRQGDCLVVTVTPDRYVNKGPGRPVFAEELRLESIAALDCVDYVVLNNEPTAVGAIYSVKPNIYVKGNEYQNAKDDLTGKIIDERQAVEKFGGSIHFTNEVTFSSSNLLNRFFNPLTEDAQEYLRNYTQKIPKEKLFEIIERIADLKVLVLGDAILDEYQYVEPLGQSAKGLHMAAVCQDSELFLGGAFIIGSHVASFSQNVSLITAIGSQCPHRELIEKKVSEKMQAHFFYHDALPTLKKKRYLFKDGEYLSKLFETYSSNQLLLNPDQTEDLKHLISQIAHDYDLILISDFGNGFIHPQLPPMFANIKTPIALNTQINSGNRGFNVVTHYPKAEIISINEPELRLAAHDRHTSIEFLAEKMQETMDSEAVFVTRGVRGVECIDEEKNHFRIPAFATSAVDRVGAGDSFFALAATSFAAGADIESAGFLGAIAAAMDVQIIGNREAIEKVPLKKFITRLYK